MCGLEERWGKKKKRKIIKEINSMKKKQYKEESVD